MIITQIKPHSRGLFGCLYKIYHFNNCLLRLRTHYRHYLLIYSISKNVCKQFTKIDDNFSYIIPKFIHEFLKTFLPFQTHN